MALSGLLFDSSKYYYCFMVIIITVVLSYVDVVAVFP